jgi:hypothetical protein
VPDDDERFEVSLFVDPEIERLLIESRTDVPSLLRRGGIDVQQSSGSLAAAPTGEREPVTVLLATAAVIVAMTPTLREAIRALSRRDVMVTERVPVPLLDGEGEAIRDGRGRPMVEWVNRKRRLRSDTGLTSTSDETSIKGPLGIEISYKSSTDEGLQ